MFVDLKQRLEALGNDVPTVINNLFAAGAKFSPPEPLAENGCIMQRWFLAQGLSNENAGKVNTLLGRLAPSNAAVLHKVVRLNDTIGLPHQS